MPGTFTRYGITTLAGTDQGLTIDNWSAAAMPAIDALLAPSDQGLLASRPVSSVGSPSGKSGRTYFATDTGQFFRDNGTGWDEIQVGLITTADLGANIVTAPKIEAQQAWQAITLTGFNSGDINGDGQPDNVVHYYKDSLGMVHFRGDFTLAASPSVTSTLCTMPAGYRVGADQYLQLFGATGSLSIPVIARSDGTIKVVVAPGTNALSWSSVHYRAEN